MDRATTSETYFEVQFVQTNTVTELKPASIVVTDYYECCKLMSLYLII